MKKLWIGLMALVLLLATAGMATAEQEITLNTPTYAGVYDSDNATLFRFTPTESGLYEFYSLQDGEEDDWFGAAACVLDEDRQIIAEADYDYYRESFSVLLPLTAGKTYYFSAMYSHNYWWIEHEGRSYKVQLEKKEGLEVRTPRQAVYSYYNETGTVIAEAWSYAGGLTYQWYDGDEAIPGATEASYTYPALTEPKTYRCTVTDAAGNTADVTVEARVYTELKVYGNGESTIEVEYGGSADLSVTVNASYKPEDVTCQWYWEGNTENGWAMVELEGETGTTLHLTNITKSGTYECEVWDTYAEECYGDYFSVYVPGDVNVRTEQTSFTPEAGGSVTMSVTATTPEDCEPLTYEWREIGVDFENVIEGAKGPTLTVDNQYGHHYYRCAVTNSRGNYDYAGFSVDPVNAWAVIEPANYEIQINDGETATLTVSTTGNEALTYQWYYFDRIVSRYTAIPGATGTTCQTGKAGNYLCKVKDSHGMSDSCYYTVIAENNFSVDADSETSLKLALGATTTLKVKATGTGLKYRWYKEEYRGDNYGYASRQIIEGAKSNTLDITCDGKCNYRCTVTDDVGNSETIYFEVAVDSGFTAEAETTYYIAGIGDKVTLSVDTQCTSGTLHYRWMFMEMNHYTSVRVPNVTGNTLTIDSVGPDNWGQYYVNIWDDYGNDDSFTFQVQVDDHFSVRAASSTEVEVKAGESAVLAMNISCDDMSAVSIQWYKQTQYESNGSVYWKTQRVTDAAGTSLNTGAVNEYTIFYCNVKDLYGHNESVYFDVSVDNEFEADALDGENEISVEPGETAELTVAAKCKNGALSYTWYEAPDHYYQNDILIDGADGATYTTDAINKARTFRCIVKDQYKNSSTITFYVTVDNKFQAEADGEDEFMVLPGASATMAVTASCKTGSLHYEWFRQTLINNDYWSSPQSTGATTASYTTGPVNTKERYECRVSDDYGNSTEIWFTVNIDNELAVVPVGTKLRRVAPGAGLTLAVTATCRQGELTYRWYKARVYQDEDGNGNIVFDYSDPIDGEDSDSCEIESVTYYSGYRCEVTDEYSGSETVDFTVYAENHLTVDSAIRGDDGIPYGGQATIDVTASCDTGDLYYRWFKYDDSNMEWTRLAGETGSSLTTEALYEKENPYYCEVRDDYGNGTDTYMYLYPETGLTAEADGEDVFHYTGEPITLAVEAGNDFQDTDFNYRWCDPYNNEIAYGSESSVTLTDPAAGEYQCDVSDGRSNMTVSFYIFRDEAAAYGVGSGREYLPGETATMRVIAWNAENDITYQWYDTDQYDEETGTYQLIEGATEAEYSFEVNHNRNIGCRVSSPGWMANIYFSACVKNTLRIDTAGLSRINMIPAGGSLEMTINVTSKLDCDPAIQWYRNGQAIPGGTDSTLTITEAGSYRIKAEDPYGNNKEVEVYCVEGQAATLAEGQTATGPETGMSIWQFIPAKTGTYQMETEEWPEIYPAGEWGPKWCSNGTWTAGLEAGKTYYVLLHNEYESFKYTLLEEEQDEAREYTIILQKGMRLEFPWSISKVSGYSYFDHAASSKQSVIRVTGDEMTLRNEGTADVTVTYDDGSQVIYHITVTSGNTLALPEDLETIEADAFNGDGNVKFIKIGRNVQRIERGAFANMGTVCVMIENEWNNIEYGDGVFTNTQPVFICEDYGYAAGYCNEHDIPHLEPRE